jgi:hypothetical protein
MESGPKALRALDGIKKYKGDHFSLERPTYSFASVISYAVAMEVHYESPMESHDTLAHPCLDWDRL